MTLGTCSFNHLYNGSKIERKDCFKLIDYFYEHGGKTIDSARNYCSHDIIAEWNKNNPNNNLKVITKIWIEEDIDKCFDELNVDKIYCIMLRDSRNEDLLKKLKSYQSKGYVEKVGVSIYYSHEILQHVNSFIIPANVRFIQDLQTMLLHADVYVRSLFNYIPDKNIASAKSLFNEFKKYERKDLNHEVSALVGISSLEQLKENMKELG